MSANGMPALLETRISAPAARTLGHLDLATLVRVPLQSGRGDRDGARPAACPSTVVAVVDGRYVAQHVRAGSRYVRQASTASAADDPVPCPLPVVPRARGRAARRAPSSRRPSIHALHRLSRPARRRGCACPGAAAASRRRAGRPRSGSGVGVGDPLVVDVGTALGDRPTRRALARHQLRLAPAGRRTTAARHAAGSRRAAPRSVPPSRVAASSSRRSPVPNSAAAAALTRSVSSAPCVSVVTSSARTR